jgi:NADPH-dependent glutamate synthase beta subunit-like oxidoreductase/coenzyme F420-reducing hydrogenase delta subunit
MSISAMPPCQAACPIHTDVRGYVAALAEGDIEEAIRIVREVNPFPSVCGRICTRTCESACRRAQVDDPIAIASLKRYAADHTKKIKHDRPPGPFYNEKIAVVGGGPSGLTSAHDLSLLGYKVTVFEAAKELGGMLSRGIPEYRLPRSVVFTIDKLLKKYHAVFLALGSERSIFPKCKGVELPGIITAVEFLKQVSKGERPHLGKDVVVVGGGHTAVDAARTCLRLGSKNVTIVYRRTLKEMPAGKTEAEEALHEGIHLEYLTAPVEFIGNGKVTEVKCVRMQLADPGQSRRSRLVPIEDSEFEIKADAVILAIGYNPMTDTIKEIEVLSGKKGTIIIKDDTGATNIKGVFAGGDVVTGPMSVIKAIASGKKVADSIHRYLRNLPPRETEEPVVLRPLDEKIVSLVVKSMREKMPAIPVQKRMKSFEEVDRGFSKKQVFNESRRCLQCGAGAVISDECVACFNCVMVCPYGVPVAGEDRAKIDISQCQACGVCASECPSSAIDVRLEPRERSRKKLQKALEHARKESPEDFSIEFYCQYQEPETPPTPQKRKKSRQYPVGKPCMARIGVKQLLQPFEEGAKEVEIYKCEQDDCRFTGCDEWIIKHIENAQKILGQIGMDTGKLKFVKYSQEKSKEKKKQKKK